MIGDTAGDGEVVFIGINESLNDVGLTSNETYYYNIYSFNSGGGSLIYNSTPNQVNSIVT